MLSKLYAAPAYITGVVSSLKDYLGQYRIKSK